MSKIIRTPSFDPTGSSVSVYLNLHLPGRVSVRALTGALKGKVIGHALAIQLRNCEFHVSEAGRQRVLQKRCKNVHACIRGEVEAIAFTPEELATFQKSLESMLALGTPIRYNPYQTAFFETRPCRTPTHTAKKVILVGSSVTGFELNGGVSPINLGK